LQPFNENAITNTMINNLKCSKNLFLFSMTLNL